MDYRYETKDSARDFHRRRRAFIIHDGAVEFMPAGTAMSHYEYCLTKGIEKEKFNKLTRGYYLDGNLVFYKDNFGYDDSVIEEGLLHLKEISEELKLEQVDVYFGLIVEKNFAFDKYYGKYIKEK